LIASRKRNIECKREGEILEKRMLKMSCKSAAQLVTVSQTHVLGKPLRNRVRDDILKLKMEQQDTKIKQEQQYRTLCNIADEVIKKNKKKDYPSWSIADLKAVIKPLKKKEDGAFPSKKKRRCCFGTRYSIVYMYLLTPISYQWFKKGCHKNLL
jgi:hypothetical protein